MLDAEETASLEQCEHRMSVYLLCPLLAFHVAGLKDEKSVVAAVVDHLISGEPAASRSRLPGQSHNALASTRMRCK